MRRLAGHTAAAQIPAGPFSARRLPLCMPLRLFERKRSLKKKKKTTKKGLCPCMDVRKTILYSSIYGNPSDVKWE